MPHALLVHGGAGDLPEGKADSIRRVSSVIRRCAMTVGNGGVRRRTFAPHALMVPAEVGQQELLDETDETADLRFWIFSHLACIA